jgi:hypothetical protein
VFKIYTREFFTPLSQYRTYICVRNLFFRVPYQNEIYPRRYCPYNHSCILFPGSVFVHKYVRNLTGVRAGFGVRPCACVDASSSYVLISCSLTRSLIHYSFLVFLFVYICSFLPRGSCFSFDFSLKVHLSPLSGCIVITYKHTNTRGRTYLYAGARI